MTLMVRDPVSPPPTPPRSVKVRQPMPPRPPKRLPRSMIRLAPLTRSQILAQAFLAIVAALLVGFILNLTVLSHLEHAVNQQQLGNTLRAELKEGTAPVSEGTFDDVLLADGAPVAILEIPQLGVHEVIVEGTGPNQLKLGPGHRRDTVLPGQLGLSVLMARAAAYGGPFSRIQELGPGDTFSVTTGQGVQKFRVLGVRYAGDVIPAVGTGESRLILETARGAPFVPTGVAYVDATLIGTAQPSGLRQTSFATLPPQQHAMATDTTQAWALVFALQFFIAAELAAVWTYRRIGAQKMWIVFLPVLLLAALLVADQVNSFLPNLL